MVMLACSSWKFEQICRNLCRRERDHSEAERAQHIKQIRDLQEHLQEKERQLIDLQEQVCIDFYALDESFRK